MEGGAWEGQGSFLVVQWLGLCISTAEGMGSIPVQGTKIPQAIQPSQKIKDTQRNEEYQTQESGCYHRPEGEGSWEGGSRRPS